MRRRPMLPDTRRDVATRPAPVRTASGRIEGLPVGIVGVEAGRPAPPPGAAQRNEIHRIVLVGVAGQDPGSPSGDVQWGSHRGRPQQPAGFRKTRQEIADNGYVVEITCELTGTLWVDLSILWSTYRDGGDVTLTVTSAATGESAVVFEAGPATSRYFNDDELAIDVYNGDTVRLTVPG